MPPKTPDFWQTRNCIAKILLPFSCLYLAGHKIKTAFANPYHSKIPVICVGGVVAGGSGKTPVVHALIQLFLSAQICERPVILTRGYGGRLKGPTSVDPSIHGVEDVGDEAILHAWQAHTIVSANRASGAKLAESIGADLIVMDDGLQNSTIQKTLSFLVFNGAGNGFVLPAGPLREPLKDALDKCACVIKTKSVPLETKKPVLESVVSVTSQHDKSGEFFGFAGLGVPEKFRDTLIDAGFTLNGFETFPDHHPYSERDIERLKNKAANATLITTQKDFVRIPEHLRDGIDVLMIEASFTDPDAILSIVREALQR